MAVLYIEQIISFVALILSITNVIIIATRPSSEEQKISMTFSFFAVITCLGYFGTITSGNNIVMLIFTTKIKYIGAFGLLVIWPQLLSYFGFRIWNGFRNFSIIIGLCLVIMVLNFNSTTPFDPENPSTWLYFMRHWFFKSYYMGIVRGIPFLKPVVGWGYNVFIALVVCYFTDMLIALAFILHKSHAALTKDIISLFLIHTLPAGCYLIERVAKLIYGNEVLPIVPMGMAIGGLLSAYLVIIRKFYNVSMLANNVMFDLVNAPAIVADSGYKLLNINETAYSVFPQLSPEFLGRPALSVLPSVLSQAVTELLSGEKEVQPIFARRRVYQPKLKRLVTGKNVYGFVMWMEDVTMLHDYRERLENEVERKTSQLTNTRDVMVMGFASLAEHHDLSSRGHLRRTAFYTEAIAKKLLEEGLFPEIVDSDFVSVMRRVSPLHDIGKSYVDEEILNKDGVLSEEERTTMQSHTTFGSQFIKNTLKNTLKDENADFYAQMAWEVALYHHEWWDGSGYPTGKKGNDIPLSARIMAVADVYDALISDRPYKKAFESGKAFDIIMQQSGTHFDPVVVKAFESIRPQIEAIARHTKELLEETSDGITPNLPAD